METGLEKFIGVAAPFLSGGIGIVVGLKVGLARLEARFENLNNVVMRNAQKLERQVGEDRCDKIRKECKDHFDEKFDDLKKDNEAQHNWFRLKLDEFQRFIGRFNGRNHD